MTFSADRDREKKGTYDIHESAHTVDVTSAKTVQLLSSQKIWIYPQVFDMKL